MLTSLQDILSSKNVGFTIGVGITLNVGFFVFSAQLLGTVTSNGDWSVDLALSVGMTTSVGFGISIGGSFMISDIDSIEDMKGYGAGVGGSYSPQISAGTIVIGIEGTLIGDLDNGNSAHKGITFTINYDWMKFDTEIAESLTDKFDNPNAEVHWSQANTIHLLDADILNDLKNNVLGYIE